MATTLHWAYRNLSNRYSRHHLTRFTNSKNEEVGKPKINLFELLAYGIASKLVVVAVVLYVA